MTITHPQRNDKGQTVPIHSPSTPTLLSTWSDPNKTATVTPAAPMPDRVNGISIATWRDPPSTAEGWELLARDRKFDEPPMPNEPGKKTAAGAICIEPDGRVWVVSPSNGFAGYTSTFPKGTVASGASLRATAIKETYEESGLQVQRYAYLCDSSLRASVTRYYLARRVTGNPADMGWESQAVHLVPREKLGALLTNKNDQRLVGHLSSISQTPLRQTDLLRSFTVVSIVRLTNSRPRCRAQFFRRSFDARRAAYRIRLRSYG